MCRALGIPCRPVTNFESAHGQKSAIKLHRFYDKYGREMTRANNFSLWYYSCIVTNGDIIITQSYNIGVISTIMFWQELPRVERDMVYTSRPVDARWVRRLERNRRDGAGGQRRYVSLRSGVCEANQTRPGAVSIRHTVFVRRGERRHMVLAETSTLPGQAVGNWNWQVSNLSTIYRKAISGVLYLWE